MSATCDRAAEAVTRELGFDCHDVSPVVSVRNPFDLAHWTMPLLELLIIAGAGAALVLAVRRYRAGDPVSLALWFAPLVYLFVTEPPLYFPEWFGLDDRYGFIFAHNLFTVQFMWDRLPLYIIAIYPAMTALAYEVVRALGVFRDRGALLGSVAVAFVCHVFYEIFDHLGPTLGWWAWNDANVPVNHPALDLVPMNSMLLFASVSFGVLTWLVVRLTPGRRGWSLGWRVVVAGVLSPPAMAVAGIPSSLFGGDSPDLTAQAWVLGVELGLVWLAGGWVLLGQVRRAAPPEDDVTFARVYPAAYVGLMVVFWVATVDELGTGSILYSLTCLLAAATIVVVLHARRQRDAVAA